MLWDHWLSLYILELLLSLICNHHILFLVAPEVDADLIDYA